MFGRNTEAGVSLEYEERLDALAHKLVAVPDHDPSVIRQVEEHERALAINSAPYDRSVIWQQQKWESLKKPVPHVPEINVRRGHYPERGLKIGVRALLLSGLVGLVTVPNHKPELTAGESITAYGHSPSESSTSVMPNLQPGDQHKQEQTSTTKQSINPQKTTAATDATVTITTQSEFLRLPNRTMNAPMEPELRGVINKLPRLEQLNAAYPKQFPDIQRVKAHIAYLEANTHVTAADFLNYKPDETRINAFSDNSEYKKTINPKFFIIHWTSYHYPGGVDQFIVGMKSGKEKFSCAYFLSNPLTNAMPTTYKFFDHDNRKSACALGVNHVAQGLEVEAWPDPNDRDSKISPIYEHDPMVVAEIIKFMVWYARRNNLAINEYTFLTHMAADLAVRKNAKFNPKTGEVTGIRKQDSPQEFLEMLLRKAQKLDSDVG